MASAATALGELRRALRGFLDEAGNDPQYKAVVGEARQLDTRLGEASRGDSGGPSPGQRAAGLEQNGGGQPAGSPGSRAAGRAAPPSFPGGPQGSPRSEARSAMGAPPSGAKGQGSNLPPFMERQRRMKGRATARGGP